VVAGAPVSGSTTPKSAVTAPRRVAYEVLAAVREGDAYANLLLPGRIAQAGLSTADAGLATELCYGTLRWRGFDDRVIGLAAGRALSKIDAGVLDVLRLGVHQLLRMRVPAHAVIDESVKLVRTIRLASAAGFVNAVLRNVSRSPADEWTVRVTDGLSGDELLAVLHSHPLWVVGALRDALAGEGLEGENREAELESLLAADNLPPRVSLVALPGLADAAGLGEPGEVSPIAVRSPGGDPSAMPEVAAGRVRVQDEGSQLAALALTRARPVLPGERWLDLCAGPGGKAALLAAEARLGGATLLANELVPARAGLVRHALAVFDSPPTVVEGDGTRFATGPDRFDRILLDAPCTGLGALRRRPEARWRKQPGDVAQLVALQSELLEAAVQALAPGGLIAYVTCSPHLAETREVVDAALARHPELTRVDTPKVLAGIATRDLALPPGTHAQLWPHRHGTDAMFMQLIAKVAP
jgi:16S rRNA (cytosine967-C5)-methyltransferase